MSYIERERQRAETTQQEQLDWLYQHHTELTEQTALLREIRKHTGLVYGVLLIWLALTGIGLIFLIANFHNA